MFRGINSHKQYIVKSVMKGTGEVNTRHLLHKDFQNLYSLLCLASPGAIIQKCCEKTALTDFSDISSDEIKRMQKGLESWLRQLQHNVQISDLEVFKKFLTEKDPQFTVEDNLKYVSRCAEIDIRPLFAKEQDLEQSSTSWSWLSQVISDQIYGTYES